MRLLEMYQKLSLKNPAAIIDANHSNSNKRFKDQIRIVREVLHSRRHSSDLQKLIKGVMIESYLEEGSQPIGADLVYGKSITDPCLGWSDTRELLLRIADECKGYGGYGSTTLSEGKPSLAELSCKDFSSPGYASAQICTPTALVSLTNRDIPRNVFHPQAAEQSQAANANSLPAQPAANCLPAQPALTN